MSLSDRSQKKFYIFCPLPDCIWLLLCTFYAVSVSSQLIWYSCLFLVVSPGLGPTWARIGPSLWPMFFWRPRVDFLQRAQVRGIPDFFQKFHFLLIIFFILLMRWQWISVIQIVNFDCTTEKFWGSVVFYILRPLRYCGPGQSLTINAQARPIPVFSDPDP